MGSVFKKTFTKRLPTGAAISTRKGQQWASWKDAKGRSQSAIVTSKSGQDRIAKLASTYTAKYRDGQGRLREVATGCRDFTAAKKVLADLEKRADQVRSGIRSAAEDAVVDHQRIDLQTHVAAFLIDLGTRSTSQVHQQNVKRCIDRVVAGCGFQMLKDLDRGKLERWMIARQQEGMGARTRNTHRAAIVSFGNWCVTTDRLVANPLRKAPKAAEDSDRRRNRRAMTTDELTRLLAAAQRRPLEERLRINRGRMKGRLGATVREATRRKLEVLGRERALIYKTLFLTGLRRGELASLTVGHLALDAPTPYVTLSAASEKNRKGSEVALRDDLAGDLRSWLSDRLKALQATARSRGETPPSCLPSDTPVFRVPDKLVKVFNRDLKAAGIAKQDDRGRTLDVHALRHTFITHLSKGGVAPRTAQAAARHSKTELTMKTYTDPRLLDVRGALEVLPELPLPQGVVTPGEAGSANAASQALAPLLAPNPDSTCQSPSQLVKMAVDAAESFEAGGDDVSVVPVKQNDPLTVSVNGSQAVGDTRLELVTPSLSS